MEPKKKIIVFEDDSVAVVQEQDGMNVGIHKTGVGKGEKIEVDEEVIRQIDREDLKTLKFDKENGKIKGDKKNDKELPN